MNDQAPQIDAPPPVTPDPAPEDVMRQEAETTGTAPDIPLDREYSKVQLDAAAEEVKMITPEQWIEMTEYIHALEDIGKLGEAPGIAWTTLYSESTGGQMNVTARATTTKAAIEDMFDAVKYVMKWQSHMKWSTAKTYAKAPTQQAPAQRMPAQTSAPPPAAANTAAPAAAPLPPAGGQQVTYEPIAGSGVEKFQVASIEHAISKNGNPFVRVKTVEPAFAKFGVNAWKETVPIEFESWPIDQLYQPPPEMTFCLVDTSKSPKKVTAFTAE